MTKDCTTHHHACDCREAKFAAMEQQLAELREAAGELVANAEWDGDISAVDTDDLKALRATLLQEPPHPLPERS